MPVEAIEERPADRIADLDGRWIAVEIPATSANLGAGYDCLAVALEIVDRIEVECLARPGAGVEIAVAAGTARAFCERLAERGVLAKDTHAQVIRLAPPLIVQRAELDWLVEQLKAVLR